MIGLVDIGGTKLLAAVAKDGSIGPPVRESARLPDPLSAVFSMLDQLSAGEAFDAISIGTPGPFDRQSGELRTFAGMSLGWHQNWLGVRLVDQFQSRYGCPVFVENDANCAALAEDRFGAGRDAVTTVYYTISTGVGGGIVHSGQLVLGRHDPELGHQILWPNMLGGPECPCGSRGCLEALVSGESLEKRYGAPAEEIDDPAIWAEVGRWIGLAVVNAWAFADPDVVVLGGGVMARWPAIWPSLESTVRSGVRLSEPPQVRLAALGEERGLIGALILVPSSLRGDLSAIDCHDPAKQRATG